MSAFLAASMVVQTLYLLADLYWVGHIGNEAIAAVGVAGNITMVVLALTQMLGVGTTTLISQAAGRKDQPQAELVVQSVFRYVDLDCAGFGCCRIHSSSGLLRLAQRGRSDSYVGKSLSPLVSTRAFTAVSPGGTKLGAARHWNH